MKLTTRVAAVMTAATALILVLLAGVTVRREVELIERDLRRDATLLSVGIAAAAASVWEAQGSAQVQATLEAVDRAEAEVEVGWLEPSDALAIGEPLWSVPSQRLTGQQGQRLVSVAPVQVDGQLVGAVRVSESLAVRNAFVARILSSTTVTLAAVIVLSGVLALVLGRLLVGRRVVALVERADEIARGEFGPPLLVAGRDELADLMVAVNRMSEQLVEAREQARAELEGRLEAEVQLRHAARLATVGQLAAGVAHELGTPLNVISGRADLILNRLEPEDSAGGDARIIREQADRVSRIVRQLLDYARRRDPARRTHDLGKLARTTATLLQPQARARDLELEVEVEVDDARAMIDASQLQQVLMNLLLNAVQASPPGSTVSVCVRSGPADDELQVAVVDRGPGIPAEDLARVFTPFFTTKEPGEGTGLGLAVALGIIEDHGGRIDVESTPGSGSRFVAIVPRGGAR